MKNNSFNIKLAVSFMALFAAFWLWQSPGILTGKLTSTEIDHYLSLADRQLVAPIDEKKATLARVRAWAEADDGKPFYMLNLMRLHDKLRQFPGSLNFNGTPKEANQTYEDATLPMLIANAGSAPYGSDIHDKALITLNSDPAADNFTRLIVVRYPNRRAFLQLLGSPDYAKMAPLKFMAQEILLVPTTGDLVIPDPRAICGAILLIAYLLIGWIRSSRTTRQPPQKEIK